MKRLRITVEGIAYEVTVEELDAAAAAPGPLAGTVVSVAVSVGQSVAAGDLLLVLEAMKMNTNIGAPQAGTVSAVNVGPGATVTEGQILVTLA